MKKKEFFGKKEKPPQEGSISLRRFRFETEYLTIIEPGYFEVFRKYCGRK
ncbi:MAG: hypothetical protein J5858_13620 [Lentisphaeria bacterium]|nr:hypothetical protein [Lentisphaeria bacterium]